MKQGKFSEEEIERILRRYDRDRKLSLDEEKSDYKRKVFRPKDADAETGQMLRLCYERPDYIFIDRWDENHRLAVSAVYEKSEGKVRRLYRKKHRRKSLAGQSLFSIHGETDTDNTLSYDKTTVSSDDTDNNATAGSVTDSTTSAGDKNTPVGS